MVGSSPFAQHLTNNTPEEMEANLAVVHERFQALL
jgi:hypothetical protein